MSTSVLYVDDDHSLCQIVSKALQSEGYSVRTLHDGEEALTSLREYVPDLIMLDVLLPRRDGFELLADIRGLDGPARDVPVVIVTGCSPTPAYAQRANELRASDLLAKPVPLETLLEVVARCTRDSKRPVSSEPVTRQKRAQDASGSFDRVPFPAVLHHLHGLRASGVLHLASGKRRKWIQMRDGYPVAVRSNLLRETLGVHLVRSGRITEKVLEASRREMREAGLRQGEILVAMDVLSEDQVAEALREQADHKLFEMFGWNKGTFRFERGGELQRANALGLGRSPANLILEGVRAHFSIERIDRYFEKHRSRFVAHGESPFYRFQDLRVDPADEGLLRGIDGSQRLEAFCAEDERLRCTVYGLLASGLLELRNGPTRGAQTARPVKPQPVRPSADTAAVEERVSESAQAHDPRQDDPRHLELLSMAEQLRERHPFEVLGVSPDSTESQQREAYERVSARTHPDHFSNASQAVRELSAEVFAMVRDAYDTLCDPRTRQLVEIDRKRAERKEEERLRSERALEAETEFRKGEDSLGVRRYESALAHFGKALELFPEEGDYHAHYGWALYLSYPDEPSIVGEALEHVKRGLKLASHREKPYLFMGRLYKAVGRVDTAEKMFTRAVQIQPECLEALRELRLIQMRREKSKGLIGRLLRR